MLDQSSQHHKTSVWIVDDNVHFCVVVAEAINRSATLCCEHYFHDIRTAKNELLQTSNPPLIILLDINMPHISGLDGIMILKKIYPNMHVVMLTSYENEHEIKIALQRGASGYLSKTSSCSDIIQSIDRLKDGGKIIDPTIADKMVDMLVSKDSKKDYHLSNREIEIIKLLSSGLSINDIAKRLDISSYTIETHRRNIFLKLNVHNSRALVAKAYKEGLIG